MARMIPKRVIEEIRFRSDIVDVIGSYLQLKKAGSAFKTCCPFHNEKTPSFHVNAQRQIFHCFGCGAGGDVFGFVMQYESLEFTEAAKLLADRAGVPLELEDSDGEPGLKKDVLYRVLSELAAFYQRCLRKTPSAAAARAYLEERDLTGDTLETFGVGYAPEGWDTTLRWAKKHKVGTDVLETAGMIIENPKPESRNRYYDRFRNRIMFPICNEQGRVIGFSGRTLEQNPRAAKYVNSPETPLFTKSRILYAMDKARRAVADEGEAVICEGQIDVIRCHQAGFATAVAAQGTAFTEDHARIIRRYGDSVCLVFDPDTAGQVAAVRAAGVFMAAGLAVRVAALPAGEDPDTFIRAHGAEAFRDVLARAQSAVGFQVGVLSTRYDPETERGVMRIARALLDTIRHSPNAVQRAKLVQEAAERLRLPPSALMDDLRHTQRASRRRAPDPSGEDAGEPAPASTPSEEVTLCEHLVRAADHPALADLVERYLPIDMLADADCRAVVEASLASVRTGRTVEEVLRDGGAPGPSLQQLAARVLMAPPRITGVEFSPEDAVKDLILFIWRREFQKQRSRAEGPRRLELTSHLHHLKTWEDGAAIIEIEMAED